MAGPFILSDKPHYLFVLFRRFISTDFEGPRDMSGVNYSYDFKGCVLAVSNF